MGCPDPSEDRRTDSLTDSLTVTDECPGLSVYLAKFLVALTAAADFHQVIRF